MTKRLLAILMIALTAMPLTAATRRALLIGLGKQQDTRWGRIHGDNDVLYIAATLKEAGYTDIRKLTNERATKAAIVASLTRLERRCAKGDIVYIHYSGHGQLMTDINGDEAEKWSGTNAMHADWDEALIPYDAYMTYCAQDRGEKHLCDDELSLLLSRIRDKIGSAGRLTIAIDACHSGDATSAAEAFSEAPEAPEPECVRGIDVKFSIPREPGAKAEKPLPERWQTISACKPYQLCTEMKDRRIGKLTAALCSLGAKMFTMGNAELESALNEYIGNHRGILPQNPMVTGER